MTLERGCKADYVSVKHFSPWIRHIDSNWFDMIGNNIPSSLCRGDELLWARQLIRKCNKTIG